MLVHVVWFCRPSLAWPGPSETPSRDTRNGFGGYVHVPVSRFNLEPGLPKVISVLALSPGGSIEAESATDPFIIPMLDPRIIGHQTFDVDDSGSMPDEASHFSLISSDSSLSQPLLRA